MVKSSPVKVGEVESLGSHPFLYSDTHNQNNTAASGTSTAKLKDVFSWKNSSVELGHGVVLRKKTLLILGGLSADVDQTCTPLQKINFLISFEHKLSTESYCNNGWCNSSIQKKKFSGSMTLCTTRRQQSLLHPVFTLQKLKKLNRLALTCHA